MPTKDPSHAQGVMMKMLSSAMFGGMGACMMMAPNMGSQMAMNGGASMVYQAMNGVQSSKDKKRQISETESIMLYNMVRTTADKLVKDFRDYKANSDKFAKTTANFQELQNMANAGKANASKQLDNYYTLKKLNSIWTRYRIK